MRPLELDWAYNEPAEEWDEDLGFEEEWDFDEGSEEDWGFEEEQGSEPA